MTNVPVFCMPRPVFAAQTGIAAIVLSILLNVVTGPAFGQTTGADRVIATVNGVPVHISDIKLADEIVGRNLPTQDPVERPEALLQIISDSIMLAQAAEERKIADETDLQRRATYARNQGLMNHLLEVIGQQAVSEESIQKTYQDVVVKGASKDPELHLRHIVLLSKDPRNEESVKEAEARAQAALKRIKNGEDFGTVAADVSDDLAAKANKGDYGWRTRSEMGKEYGDAAFVLKNGEVSPLFKTIVGWHIVKLEDQRLRQPVPLERIRSQLANMIKTNAQLDFMNKTRAAAKIVRVDAPADADKAAPKSN